MMLTAASEQKVNNLSGSPGALLLSGSRPKGAGNLEIGHLAFAIWVEMPD